MKEKQNIILYTTHCQKCRVLESKLKSKQIPYTEFSDTDEMIKMGIKSAPYLGVDGKMMNFVEANKYINTL